MKKECKDETETRTERSQERENGDIAKRRVSVG